jgi:hypothetical protein
VDFSIVGAKQPEDGRSVWQLQWIKSGVGWTFLTGKTTTTTQWPPNADHFLHV